MSAIGQHRIWLDEQLKAGRRTILPGLTYLPSGDVIDIGEDREWSRIGGIGGYHCPSNYERRSREALYRRTTSDPVERLVASDLECQMVRRESLQAATRVENRAGRTCEGW